MRRVKLKLLVVCIVVGCLVAAVPAFGGSGLMIDSLDEWAQYSENIRPMTEGEYLDYMFHLYVDPEVERDGEPYPASEFSPAGLYVYEGDPCEEPTYPTDAGLVMYWSYEELVEGTNYCAAWRFDYGQDPDIRRHKIKVSVTPPSGCNILTVSFAIQDALGRRCSWWWWTPATIPYDVSTTVVIDMAKTGRSATTPKADGWACNNLFDPSKAQFFDVDESGQYIFGMSPIPTPGQQQFMVMWNYWHNLIVLPPIAEGKNFVKWSQPPVPIDPCIPHDFNAWDEHSNYEFGPILADDWLCEDDRPVTDVHWWGSFIGWTQPQPPPIVPKAFHIGIWTDDPCDFPGDFSHPNELIWENYCDNWVWNFAGFDVPPWGQVPGLPEEPESKETNFQFNQLLSQDEWFYQEPNNPEDEDPNSTVYWLSIAAVYNPEDYTDPNFYHWGWKTRPHYFNDDAVRITDFWDGLWPPTIGSTWGMGDPVCWPDPNTSWDLAFQLTTSEGLSADLHPDGRVDFRDLAVLASQWLTAVAP